MAGGILAHKCRGTGLEGFFKIFENSLEPETGGVWLGADCCQIAAKMPFGLMGILNLTLDSFFDGGRFNTVGAALAATRHLLKSGADIIDIGAESTRPGAEQVDARDEMERLIPVLRELRASFPEAVISVDTTRAGVAARSLQLGARIINDVGACRRDPELLDVLCQFKPAYVLMHSYAPMSSFRAASHHDNTVDEIKQFFERKLRKLTAAGLPEEHIALDPGIGFGKTLAQNLDILQNMPAFLEFGRPLLIGLSMKSFFGELLGLALDERAESTAIASALLWQKGVFWHRVHNVAQVRSALFLASELAGARSPGIWEDPEQGGIN